MRKTRIIIADDHDLFRESLVARFERDQSDIQVVGHVNGGHALLDLIVDVECDIILLDMVMPGSDSLDILKILKTEFPHIKVLMVTSMPEEAFATRFLKAGASGYLLKEMSFDKLLQSIMKVFNGHMAISSVIKDKLTFECLQKEDVVTHEILSDREFQVMCLMSSGRTLSEVANELYLSPKTISTYRNIIMEKMGWDNNAQMMHYCLSRGLCDLQLPVGV